MPEKFDFRKIEDQDRFSKLPQQEKDVHIDTAMDESQKLRQLISAGVVSSYDEAVLFLEKTKEAGDYPENPEEMALKVAEFFKINYTQECLQKFIKENAITLEFLNSDYVKTAIKNVLINHLRADKVYRWYEYKGNVAGNIFKKLPQHRDILKNEEIQQAAKECLLRMLKKTKDGIFYPIDLVKNFEFDDTTLRSEEVQKGALEMFYLTANSARYDDDNFNYLVQAKEYFLLDDKDLWPSLEPLVIKFLDWDYTFDKAITIKNAFHMPMELIYSDNISKVTEAAMIKYMGNPDSLNKLRTSFDPLRYIASLPKIHNLALAKFQAYADTDYQKFPRYDVEKKKMEIMNMQKTLVEQIDLPEARQVIKNKIIEALRGRQEYQAIELKNEFEFTADELADPEIKSAALVALADQFGNYNRDNSIFKIAEEFHLPEKECWDIVTRRLGEVYLRDNNRTGDTDDYEVQKIIDYFHMPSDTYKKAAIIGVISDLNNGFVFLIQKVVDRAKLTKDDLKSPEVIAAATQCLVNSLAKGRSDDVNTLMDCFDLQPEDIEPMIASVLDEYVATGLEGRSSLDPVLPFGLWGCQRELASVSAGLKEKIWQKVEEQIKADPFISKNWDIGQRLFGPQKWMATMKNNPNIWIGYNSLHDSLLFIEKLEGLLEIDEAERNKFMRLVVLPIVNSNMSLSNLRELSQALGSFDYKMYLEKFEGEVPPFQNLGEFMREVHMQVENIQMPANASEAFKEAFDYLISINGVDVPFLKKMMDMYATDNASTNEELSENMTEDDADEAIYYDDEYPDYDENNSRNNSNFARRLIDIIEGVDDIDERKLIWPWSESFALDPVYRLVFTAVGMHSINRLTPKFQECLGIGNPLSRLIEVLQEANSIITKQIIVEYDKKIKAEPQKKDRHLADRDKMIKKESLLIFAKGGDVGGVNNFEATRWEMTIDDSNHQELLHALDELLDDGATRRLVFQALSELANKEDVVAECIDLLPFSSQLTVIAKEIVRRYGEEEFLQVQTADIKNLLSGHEISLVAYLMYLTFNNRRRQSESKQFKKSIDGIIGQKDYVLQLKKLKEEGRVPEKSDVFLAYTRGLIELRPDDLESVKGILQQYGYEDVGRDVIAEIAAGSNYRAWTCGDATDCCMPFTSSKNQEYLLRDDTAYFLVKVADVSGREEIIAQSVLIDALDHSENKYDKIIALDNIEIANRAINMRSVIKEAYDKLRNELISRNSRKKLKIIIGTSYNDDGGVITGNLPLETLESSPAKGRLEYSDCFSHSSAFTMYDSLSLESHLKLYGVQADLFDNSRVHELISSKEERNEVVSLLARISQGEDDGDGGLIFPDNYSALVFDTDRGESVGYVIAADYIREEDDPDSVFIEKIRFRDSITAEEKEKYLSEYMEMKGLRRRSKLWSQIVFTYGTVAVEPELKSWLKRIYGKKNIRSDEEGNLIVYI